MKTHIVYILFSIFACLAYCSCVDENYTNPSSNTASSGHADTSSTSTSQTSEVITECQTTGEYLRYIAVSFSDPSVRDSLYIDAIQVTQCDGSVLYAVDPFFTSLQGPPDFSCDRIEETSFDLQYLIDGVDFSRSRDAIDLFQLGARVRVFAYDRECNRVPDDVLVELIRVYFLGPDLTTCYPRPNESGEFELSEVDSCAH